MDYVSELMEAINNYCDSDIESKNILRDMVCIVSDNEELKKDKFVQELLYIAANKMRTFGYNIQNKFKSEPYESVKDLMLVRNEAIKRYYKSNVWDNNTLDRSQKEVIDLFSSLKAKRLLVSAPTSYGKTYLMREILYINKEQYNNVLLVFPTVALLKENTREMNDFVKKKELGYKVINTVKTAIEDKKYIFVFTPERALQLLAMYPKLEIDFFFFDEIYKIDEDYCNDEIDEKENSTKKKSVLDEARAKAFRVLLYLLSKSVKDYYLAGPNLNKDNFGKGMLKYIVSNNISVKEINFEPTLRINIEAWGGKIQENFPLLPPSPTDLTVAKKEERIDYIVNYINTKKYGQTMLYCTSPGKANEYARNLAKSSYPKSHSKSNRLDNFIDHIKDKYDIQNSVQDWSFIKVLESGFGIHHGKLPRYIQNEILSMFNSDVFDILFCTSTIVEGVNTKAKNMVLLNTSKGRELLTPFDIKNIKGRAGRYYHNFIGRVFYTDKKQKQIEDEFKMKLDFATYRDEVISDVDMDNAEIDDLSMHNAKLKSDRVEKQKSYLITNDVFLKNRLIPKDVQENLLQVLLKNDEIKPFIPLIQNMFNIKRTFFAGYFLKSILELFSKANIIDEVTAKVYNGIGYSYYKNGFYSILDYEVKKARENNTSIDTAYANAFGNLKNIVEHKIPKILSLFEAVFIFACIKKGFDVQEFSLSTVTKFYETGVSTEFGEFLVEYGFPTDSIRLIEKRLGNLVDKPLEEAISTCKKSLNSFLVLLDSYERILFMEAIDSYI